jgi:hypothetical protein
MPSEPAESNSAFHPPEGGLHRSALLGHRKARPSGLEKPQAFTPKERPPKPPAPPPAPAPAPEPPPPPLAVVPEPAPPARPARKSRAAPVPKAPKATKTEPKKVSPAPKLKTPDAVSFQALVEQVARLSEALAARPTWADLKALEMRLGSGPTQEVDPAVNAQVEHLQELLRTREEELEELGGVVSEFQEQNEKAYTQLRELTARLRQAQEEAHQAIERQRLAEGFLREALLGLLSPGDEFNEDLVEQIQHFLQPG